MKLEDVIQKENVTFLEIRSQEKILRLLAQNLVKKGYVKESFEEAVLLREKEFPTGLETELIGVAIPHTDSQHVNQASIEIGILKDSVNFNEMGNEQNTVKVRIIFMLAILEPAKQLETLQLIIELIQDTEKLTQILGSQSSEEVVKIICEKRE